MARQLPGVPSDVRCVVAHEVAHVQCVPQGFLAFVGFAVAGQLDQGVAFAGFHFGVGVGGAATQHAQGGFVQVFQQLAFPGVPHFGAGASDVGHRQQIQGCQAALIAHACRKAANDFGVAQVFFLRHVAHGEVFAHQKLDQLGVVFVQLVLAGKGAHFGDAQFGVVAASAFGNVVEQSGGVQDPGLVPAARQLRAKRVFVRVLGHEKPTHIAKHHQNVLVHRVGMKQVVLHLAHDAPKHPQVAPQHRGFVHQSHGVRDALGLLQDLQKRLPVDRVGPKTPVHDGPHVVQRTQGSGRKAFHTRRGLVQQECFQNGVWVLLVQVVAGHFDQARLFKKALVQRPEVVDRFAPIGFEPVFDVEQQYLVELGHRLGRPIVLAHQLFTGPQGQSALRGHV